MKLSWQVSARAVRKVKAFLDQHRDNPMVRRRVEKNVKRRRAITVSKATFWKGMISCLLTTQQRSGPGSAVGRFIQQQPFPLTHRRCASR